MSIKNKDQQIVSKERVASFAEVYTAQNEVNAMLDLVDHEINKLESRFFEPACGDGNFLIEVLDRKLKVLSSKYKKNQFEFEKNSIVVNGSLYGIDVLSDNVVNTRKRLKKKFFQMYEYIFKNTMNQNFVKSINFIIDKNIIHGDALTLKKVNLDVPVIFSEWTIVNSKLKRRDFTLSELMSYTFEKGTLFSDEGKNVNLASPLKEYSFTDYDMAYIND
jgi:hypothetical protein